MNFDFLMQHVYVIYTEQTWIMRKILRDRTSSVLPMLALRTKAPHNATHSNVSRQLRRIFRRFKEDNQKRQRSYETVPLYLEPV